MAVRGRNGSVSLLLVFGTFAVLAVAANARAEAWTVLAEESFEGLPADRLPWPSSDTVSSGWGIKISGEARVALVEDNAPATRGTRSLRMETVGTPGRDSEGKSLGLIALRIPWPATDRVAGLRVSFDWKMDEKAGGGWGLHLAKDYGRSGTNALAGGWLKFRDDENPTLEWKNFIAAIARAYQPIPLRMSQPDQWQRAVVVMRPPFMTYDLYLRDAPESRFEAFRNLPLGNGQPGEGLPPDLLIFGSWGYKCRGAVWYDNLQVEVAVTNEGVGADLPAAVNPPAPRSAVARFASAAPRVDGRLDVEEWTDALPVQGFAGWKKAPVTRDTSFRLLWDREHLYVGVQAREDQPESIRATTHAPGERDRADWRDDIVELFLQPDPQVPEYAQFAISAGGAAMEMNRARGREYDPEWQWAVGRNEEGWTAEMAIPWSELAGAFDAFASPRAGTTWGFNLIRHATPATERNETTLWNPMGSSFHDPVNFGALVFEAPDGVSGPVRDPEGSRPAVSAKSEMNAEVRARVDALRARMERADARLSALQDPNVHDLRQSVARRLEDFAELDASLQKSDDTFDRQIAWNELLHATRHDHRLVGWLALADHLAEDPGLIQRRYLVAQASSLDAVFPESVAEKAASAGVELSAAGRESESIQLQVVAPWEPLRNVRFEAQPLRSASGTVSDIDVRLVGYLHSPNPAFPATGTGPDLRWYPDPLVPYRPFGVEAGSSKTLWVTIHVPPHVPAGVYEGSWRIVPEGGAPTDIPVRLRVHGFTLPETPSLRVWTWFVPDHGPYRLMELDRYEAFLREFSRFRIGIDPVIGTYGSSALMDRVRATRGADGEVQFDLSPLDPYYDLAFRYGGRVFNLAADCHDAWRGLAAGENGPFRVHEPDGRVTEEQWLTETERVAIQQDPAWGPRRLPFHPSISNRYAGLLRSVVAHWKNVGRYTNAIFEGIDEPTPAVPYEEVYRRYKALVPDIPLMSFNVGPGGYPNLVGINGAWAPRLNYVPGELAALGARQRAGERIFAYICGGVQWRNGLASPDVYVWQAGPDRRVLPWLAWKWGLDGVFIFAANSAWRAYYDHRLVRDGGFDGNPWPYDRPMDDWPGRYPEVGQFVYLYETEPGRWTWIPSIRLHQWRDGIEDVDCLRLAAGSDGAGGGRCDRDGEEPGDRLFSWGRHPNFFPEMRGAFPPAP
jgi:hypothetical protein